MFILLDILFRKGDKKFFYKVVDKFERNKIKADLSECDFVVQDSLSSPDEQMYLLCLKLRVDLTNKYYFLCNK
jgi:hypothetical protein